LFVSASWIFFFFEFEEVLALIKTWKGWFLTLSTYWKEKKMIKKIENICSIEYTNSEKNVGFD